MSSWRAALLILANATAAACSFVASWFVAGRFDSALLPLMAIVLGLVGVAYFTRRAEEVRQAWRGSLDRTDG